MRLNLVSRGMGVENADMGGDGLVAKGAQQEMAYNRYFNISNLLNDSKSVIIRTLLTFVLI